VSGRIRGHYRIDSAGRVEPVTDINQAALKFRAPPPLPNRHNSRLVRISIAGFTGMVLCVGGMLAMPQIQRALISAEYAQIAPIRHMHGKHMHDMADKLLRHSDPG